MTNLAVEHLQGVNTFASLIDYLHEELEWPVEGGDPEDITFEWDTDALRLSSRQDQRLSGGLVRQLRTNVNYAQPWGIFYAEFTDGRIYRTSLREVLRGLVASRRRDPHLPSWQHDNLLFICATHNYERVSFAHFRGEQMQKARLATFGWRRDSSYMRTLLEFNLPKLHWPDEPSDTTGWIKQWTSAFDKEPLTREFFRRFDKCLEQIKSDLQKYQSLPSAEAYANAQLLLERLLFTYFLQNRGWLNRQRHYLIDHFESYRPRPNGFDYYEAFLEKLFWTLSSSSDTPARLEGIPFLNGGLFDDDEFAPFGRARNNPPLKIRNSTFAFVFEHLLEAFNFTVREDTPLNQDVAVDPEMLGKVFESIVLHAESEADYNAPDKRKATGSYYTPRIVVHFICREALRLYLRRQFPTPDWEPKIQALFSVDASDGLDPHEISCLKPALQPADGRLLLEKLRTIRMCDPAVGSGAFPVGLLHELVNLRRIAETVANGYVDPARGQGSNWLHDTKADVVENGLYGVDIQQQAIEICRLRLWLSLIVDYDLGLDPFEADPTQFRQAINRISQLPNLEMNFRRGDSLLDYICGVPARIAIQHTPRFAKERGEIHRLGVQLHRAKKGMCKRELRLEILRKRLDMSDRLLTEEIADLRAERNSIADDLFGNTASESERRRRMAAEIEKLEEAQKRINKDREALRKLESRPFDQHFQSELRKLEGADFDSPFNFAWHIDFADIFCQNDGKGGFDLVLGNPPFVTARNPESRGLYRKRWIRVCEGTYQLICPFFDLSFGLLRQNGQLGFIVSNAFCKREFGKPLVENLLSKTDIQEIIDCSGLSFPGHGTPTCIVFASPATGKEREKVLVTALLPGGGDLRTTPEESGLWLSIAAHHNCPGYEDSRIAVHSWNPDQLLRWPLNFDKGSDELFRFLHSSSKEVLGNYISGSIGRICFTGADDLFFVDEHLLRKIASSGKGIARFVVGDLLRNWSHAESRCLCPYDDTGSRLADGDIRGLIGYLTPWRDFLENRLSYGETQLQRGLVWWEYSLVFPERIRGGKALCICEIATHIHVEVIEKPFIANRANPIFELGGGMSDGAYHLIAGWINSSSVLFILKQICYNKGAGEDEERDRFEFAGGKVQQLPVPKQISEALQGKASILGDRLTHLAVRALNLAQSLRTLAMTRIFEKTGEAYQSWDASHPGYVVPNPYMAPPFENPSELLCRFKRVIDRRESIRSEMIALQEEMDWLVYAAYGLLPKEHPAIGGRDGQWSKTIAPILREERPFALWVTSDANYDIAASKVPPDWPTERRSLWQARLRAIQDFPAIRRLEQPVYKRRWDEQWKIANRWECGEMAYKAEFCEAFDWWLSEKAEWWLGNAANGGPVGLDSWAAGLWEDNRIQAAWEVVSSIDGSHPGPYAAFARHFRNLVKSQSVPENIPWAIPWEQIEVPVPASAKKIRGKLNVPRERFRTDAQGHYLWAGLDKAQGARAMATQRPQSQPRAAGRTSGRSPSTPQPELQMGEDAEPSPERRRSIDEIERDEVMAAIRQVFADGQSRNRQTATADIARALGYGRAGSRIQEALDLDLVTAVRRGILENERGNLRLLTRNIEEYDRDFLKQMFLEGLGTKWWDRQDAIRATAYYLGFKRTGPKIEKALASAINGLIRQGKIRSESGRIRREKG